RVGRRVVWSWVHDAMSAGYLIALRLCYPGDGVVSARAPRPAATAASVPAATEPSTTVQATGPIGVQPKKWLTPGVSMTATSTAADATLVPITSGLCQPVSSVCASWGPT